MLYNNLKIFLSLLFSGLLMYRLLARDLKKRSYKIIFILIELLIIIILYYNLKL